MTDQDNVPRDESAGPEPVEPVDETAEAVRVTETVEVGQAPAPEGEPASGAADGAPEAQEAEAVEDAEEAGHDRAETPEADELAVTRMALEERTLDLQRLQAEYLNYKRRVDRDRELVRENATYAALTPIIDVLDTIDRARDHEPLEGGFKAVAEQLERVVAGLGLVKFGAAGDPFDPTIHEALSHVGTDPEVEVTTCKVVAKAGYKMGERVVRAAQVLVVDPAEPATATDPTPDPTPDPTSDDAGGE